MWTADLRPRARDTSPGSLGSSSYSTPLCVGLGANVEHELTGDRGTPSLLSSLGLSTPTFLLMASSVLAAACSGLNVSRALEIDSLFQIPALTLVLFGPRNK